MKLRICALAALALGFALPAQAAELAPGEVALHIKAQGMVPPDYAELEVSLSASGGSEEQALDDLKQREAALEKALGELGIRGSRIKAGKPVTRHDAWADAAAVEAAVDAADAAASCPAEAEEPAEECWTADYDPIDYSWSASQAVTVTVDDIGKIAEVTQAATGTDYPLIRPRMMFRDEAKARREAIRIALVNARADADIYADAMGYKIVRISAVGNGDAEMGMGEFFQLIASGAPDLANNPQFTSRNARVSVDYVMVAK